jgi:translation initiation factor IF-1
MTSPGFGLSRRRAYAVKLANRHIVRAMLSGRMMRHKIRVEVEMTPYYDLHKGRIVFGAETEHE